MFFFIELSLLREGIKLQVTFYGGERWDKLIFFIFLGYFRLMGIGLGGI